MLPVGSRLRHSRDFTEVVGRGVRAGRSNLVVHLDLPDPGTAASTGARAGFVVSKAVGGSVVRHTVVRRLRPLVAERLTRLPAGSRMVLRALPPAAVASSATLARDLDAALDRALRRARDRAVPGAPR